MVDDNSLSSFDLGVENGSHVSDNDFALDHLDVLTTSTNSFGIYSINSE